MLCIQSELPRHIQQKCQAGNGKWVHETLGEKSGQSWTCACHPQEEESQETLMNSGSHRGAKSTGKETRQRGR